MESRKREDSNDGDDEDRSSDCIGCRVKAILFSIPLDFKFLLISSSGLHRSATAVKPDVMESVSFDAAKNKEERTFVRKRPFLDMSASGDSSNQSGMETGFVWIYSDY